MEITDNQNKNLLQTLQIQERELDLEILLLRTLLNKHRNQKKKTKQEYRSSNIEIKQKIDFDEAIDKLIEDDDWKKDEKTKKDKISECLYVKRSNQKPAITRNKKNPSD